MNEMHQVLGNMDNKRQDTSLEYKLSRLGIDDDRKKEIINMRCKYCNIPYEYKEEDLKSTLEIIDLDKLKGWDRADAVGKGNWLECLDGLHKQRNFDLYKNKGKFEEFLNAIEYCNELFGLPEVIEYEGEYFISGNGKHRLTIAKCVGIKSVPVIVKK